MLSEIDINDALLREYGTEKNLLTGNGFSINIFDKFNYTNLKDIAAKYIKDFLLSTELKSIFTDLKTSDFEKVLAYLNITKRITNHYKKDTIASLINRDITNIRLSFIESLNYIHPTNIDFVSNETIAFLTNFNNIYTINYDLLLYWLLLNNEQNLNMFNDGFNYPGIPGTPWLENPIWINPSEQNIFFLHGAFHLFSNEDTYKETKDKGHFNAHSLLEKIKKNIVNDEYPLIVFEGHSEEKKKEINKSPYLFNCYNQFKNMTGSLFTFGLSFNPNSDSHIMDAIRNSNLNKIFIGYYDDISKDIQDTADKLIKAKKEVFLYNCHSAPYPKKFVINQNS